MGKTETAGRDTALPRISFRGRAKRFKEGREMKKMRGREKGKHEFPNISSKCEVYCEKIYDFRYLDYLYREIL